MFGYGEKRIIPQYLIKNALEFPSYTKYASHRDIGNLSTAKTFGIGYKYYTKTYIPNVYIKEPEISKEVPGIGKYEIAG